jgi:hypothetical protein
MLVAVSSGDDSSSNGSAPDDPFGPPKEPLLVHCIECGREYESSRIWYDTASAGAGRGGFWRCATPGCGGAGYGFDIFPADGSPGGIDGGWFDDDGNPCDPPWLSGE